MRVLIVTNHFWPENFRINDLALGLKERGHDITVFTGVPDYPGGKFYAGYGIFKRRTEDYQGVRVVRFPLIPRGQGKSLNLVFNYLSSIIFSCLVAPFYCRGKYDLIFVFDTSPVTIALPAILLKKIKSAPLFMWILDLWPESLSATGAVTSPKALNVVRGLVRFIYKNCDKLLISSRGFQGSIEETGGYSGKPVYFPNWVEPEYLVELTDNTSQQLPDLPSGFVVMFAGNIGAAQDFETIISAAEKLREHEDIHWVILGDGRKADWVRDQVKEKRLDSQFHMLGRFPAELMPSFFRRADALLLTLKNDPIFALTVPGKLQSYMASGVPIVAAVNGEGAQLVKESGAGIYCSAQSPGELSEKVLQLYRMSPEERKEIGANGLRYCSENFERNALFDKLESLMASELNQKS